MAHLKSTQRRRGDVSCVLHIGTSIIIYIDNLDIKGIADVIIIRALFC